LGALLFERFFAEGWIERVDTRAISVTDSGNQALDWLIDKAAEI